MLFLFHQQISNVSLPKLAKKIFWFNASIKESKNINLWAGTILVRKLNTVTTVHLDSRLQSYPGRRCYFNHRIFLFTARNYQD
jgi:hypothetical protein